MPYPHFRDLRLVYVNLDGFSQDLVLSFSVSVVIGEFPTSGGIASPQLSVTNSSLDLLHHCLSLG